MYKPWGGCQVRALVCTKYSYPCLALLPRLRPTGMRGVGGGEACTMWNPPWGASNPGARRERLEDWGASPPKLETRRTSRERRADAPRTGGRISRRRGRDEYSGRGRRVRRDAGQWFLNMMIKTGLAAWKWEGGSAAAVVYIMCWCLCRRRRCSGCSCDTSTLFVVDDVCAIF